MRFRNKRRRRTGTWLPVHGTLIDNNSTVGQQANFIQFFVPDVSIGPGALTRVFSAALLTDAPDPALSAGATGITTYQLEQLSSSQSYGYLLQRVVGNLFCSAQFNSNIRTPDAKIPSLVLYTAGLMVRRVDQEAPEAPVVGAFGTDPQAIENIRDPWMWRRSWIFASNSKPDLSAGIVSNDDAAAMFIQSFGVANDGTTGLYGTSTVDVKSKRRVTQEERLFLDVGVRALGIASGSSDTFKVDVMGVFDFRAFGKILTTQGNRRNATR